MKCTLESGGGVHLSNWLVDLGADADYRGFHFTAGTALARNQISVLFTGTGGKIDLSGAFLARGNEHIDTTLVVDHAVPQCTSRELFKGVLDGHARGVFQGKVIVRPDAQKTDGKQMAQVLMLSPDTEFDSKPELEIYADDVVCGHGSTSADIDEDLLFYCQSRGIPEAQARALLIESFVGEALEKVEREDVRDALTELARTWLHAVAPAKGNVMTTGIREIGDKRETVRPAVPGGVAGGAVRRRSHPCRLSDPLSRGLRQAARLSRQRRLGAEAALGHRHDGSHLSLRVRQRASRAALPVEHGDAALRGCARNRAPLPQRRQRR